MLSEYFENRIGLFQGEVLSPILYSLFVNDCEMHFIREHCSSFDLNMLNLFLLMYADDMVLFAESPESLQHMLNTLHTYNKEWKLTLNVDKTKIMVFRNGGKIKDNERFFYNGRALETVDNFNYLGMLFNYNGKFNITQKHTADQGRKAFFAINNKLKKFQFNIESKCSVFDTYVNSILNYGCEIWGFHKAKDVEKIHMSFCKNTLGVKKSTCNSLVYYELGRFPLHITRKLRILKYWIKLKNSDNCILRSCLEDRENINDTWINQIQTELNNLGLGYIFNESSIDKVTQKILEQRFFDLHKQEMFSAICRSSRGEYYQYIADNFGLQYYLSKAISEIHRKSITRFRLSSHNLNIESGRYKNELRSKRICTLCNLRDVEDEFHFILKCPKYQEIRNLYIKKYYFRRPSAFKLIQLLSVQNLKELRNLGKFLFLAEKIRKDNL